MQTFIDKRGNVGVKIENKVVFKTKDRPLATETKVGTVTIDGIFAGEKEMIALMINRKRYDFKRGINV